MLRSLFTLLAFCLLQILAIPILTSSDTPDQIQLAIQSTSLPKTVSPTPVTRMQHKRYYYPETLPDEDELEALSKAKEQAMREAGFIATSESAKTQSQQTMNVHNSDAGDANANADSDAPIAVPVHPSAHLCRSLRMYHWQDATAFLPQWQFFALASAVVCVFTIIRGIGSKT